jgi:hypothetical protein
VADATALDYSRLPSFGLPDPAEDKTKKKGVLGPGLKAGLRDLESLLGSAVQGGGKLFGSTASRHRQGDQRQRSGCLSRCRPS